MKKYVLLFLCAVAINVSFGQETVIRKRNVNYAVKEQFEVLKTNKNVRHGFFKVFFADTVLIVSGYYKNNVKTGVWHFYNPRDQVEQHYDYTNHKLIYSAKADSSFIRYEIMTAINRGDTIIFPAKIGGFFWGYEQIRQQMFSQTSQLIFRTFLWQDYTATAILSIDATGRLTAFKALIRTFNDQAVYKLRMTGLDEDSKLFVPAQVNRKPVESVIYCTYHVTIR
jgi:hypothetical protein